MTTRLTILSTRALRPAIHQLGALWGIRIMEQDFVDLQYKNDQLTLDLVKAAGQCIVFTNHHAVQACTENGFHHWYADEKRKVFCLRNETATAVQKIPGFRSITIADDLPSLAADICDRKSPGQISIIRGNEGSDELTQKLKEAGLQVEEIHVYQVINKGKRVHEPFQAALFFTAESVESFFQTNLLQKSIPCFCAGAAISMTLEMYTTNPVITVDTATQEGMLQAVNEYFFIKKKTRTNDRNCLVPGDD